MILSQSLSHNSPSTRSNIEALAQEVRKLVESGDEKLRKDVLDGLSRLTASIEEPDDTKGQTYIVYATDCRVD